MLSTMKIPLIMVLAASPLVLCGSRRYDCTHVFKNRVASFEYKYYPGYWLIPNPLAIHSIDPGLLIGRARTSDVKTEPHLQWILHDCGNSVCMESKFPAGDFEDRYVGAANTGAPHMFLDTDLSDGSDGRIHHRIWCDSCNPGGPHSSTFSNCQINDRRNNKFYSGRSGSVFSCPHCGYDSWFRWRIESPPTRVYWKVVLSHCNGGSTSETMRYTVKTSITSSTSTTTTISVNAKISMGLGAGELLQSSGGELGASFTWSRTYMELLARERTVETSTQVEPGMKWVVSQAVGEAGWTSIATDRTKTEKIPC